MLTTLRNPRTAAGFSEQSCCRTDALNHTWTYAYDAADRLISVTDPLNQTATRAYDDAGRLTSVTNPLNQTTRPDAGRA